MEEGLFLSVEVRIRPVLVLAVLGTLSRKFLGSQLARGRLIGWQPVVGPFMGDRAA
jgi:hypothetical protein